MSGIMSSMSAVLLLVVLGTTAALDLLRHPRALETTSRLGIPAGAVPFLGLVKAAAAVGIILGFAHLRLAELTGACLVVYFAIATLTHIRAKDRIANAIPAFLLMLVSLAYLAAKVAA